MLRSYKQISHDIFKVHLLIEHLVYEVWCKANTSSYKSKLNDELKELCKEYEWFNDHVLGIYNLCKTLSKEQKNNFKIAFNQNNKIKELCDQTIEPISIDTLDKKLVDKIRPFFKELYKRLLGWKLITDKYGDKKQYYDNLNLENGFAECPCCGYGDLQTIYSEGRSAYDHYLPQKHYPLSAINFNNLVPICTTCNSNEKGEVDVLKNKKALFYPFNEEHPRINITVDVKNIALKKLINKTERLDDKIKQSEIEIGFNINNDQTESWDDIFSIKKRYFGKICDNRVGWFEKVRKRYIKDKLRIENYSAEDAFHDIIEDDSDDQLGFLKSPYLSSLKSKNYLLNAIEEVSGTSNIA